MTNTQQTQESLIKALALSFSKTIREWLTEDELKEAIELNETPEYKEDKSCATHNYCDANMAMDAAFETVLLCHVDVQNNEHIDLFNAAWQLAIDNKFYNQ